MSLQWKFLVFTSLVPFPFGCDSKDPAELSSFRLVSEDSEQLIYQSITWTDAKGDVVSRTVDGSLNAEQFQRVARPWSHLDDDFIYDENAWSVEGEDGTTQTGYRVTRHWNPNPTLPPEDPIEPPTLSDALRQAVQVADDDEDLRVTFRFRNYPDWDIPVLPDVNVLSAADIQTTFDAREQAEAERAALLEDFIDAHLSPRSVGDIAIRSRFWGSGWVVAELPKRSLMPLLRDPAFLSIRLAEQGVTDLQWSLGGSRPGNRLDATQFHDAGIDGNIPNSGRHSFGRLTAGVVELYSLEDDACGWLDGPGDSICTGTSRVKMKFTCTDDDGDSDLCELRGGLPFEESTEALKGGHGTAVTSIILADHQDDQGCFVQLGDPMWSAGTCHDSTWELNGSGLAPEAGLVFAGELDPDESQTAWAQAIVELRNAHVDTANFSIFESEEPACRIKAVTTVEEEMENLFDDGVLITAGAGNNGNIGGACNANAPATLVKTLAINGYDSDVAACVATMSDCKLKPSASSNGGADATINGLPFPGVVSVIDLVAPTDISFHMRPWGSFGEVEEDPTKTFGGTSAAAPVISGLALLVKHWYLARGLTFINNPGRLHTVMLTMGDRHFSTSPANSAVATTQKAYGTDRNYGLGRAKLRLVGPGRPHGPWGDSSQTRTFAPGALVSQSFLAFPNPLPSGVDHVKCVAFQVEDMGGSKADISSIELKVTVRAKVGSSCSLSGAATGNFLDTSQDTKSMVTIRAANITIVDRCFEVALIPSHVSAAGITVQTACYFGGINDDVAEYP